MLAAPVLAMDGRLTGVVRVIDGDTLDVGDTRVRLHGIDAVEVAQTCRTEQGLDWACGVWVRDRVRAAYQGAQASCTAVDTDRYGRTVARCSVGGEDIGAALVGAGLATAYRRYSTEYVALETAAAAAVRGLWAMQAQTPEAFRRSTANTARAVPEVASSGSCAIKGNISSKGERIYHMPGQQHYDRTRISRDKGERMFCSEAEAQAAGWRRARI